MRSSRIAPSPPASSTVYMSSAEDNTHADQKIFKKDKLWVMSAQRAVIDSAPGLDSLSAPLLSFGRLLFNSKSGDTCTCGRKAGQTSAFVRAQLRAKQHQSSLGRDTMLIMSLGKMREHSARRQRQREREKKEEIMRNWIHFFGEAQR